MSSLYFANQPANDLIGSKTVPVTLTNAYTGAAGSFSVGGVIQLVFYFDYVPAEDNAVLNWKMEYSPAAKDLTDLYQDLVATAANTGLVTCTDEVFQYTGATHGTHYKRKISIPVSNKGVKISFKETATSHGTLYVMYQLSGL